MKTKNSQIAVVLITSIMCGIGMFLIMMVTFFIGRCLIWWFVSGEFNFPYEYVKKSFKIGLAIGPIAGVGTWFIEYKLRR
ncbi:hypothetical protein [Photorhabdus tasmaniensis]|uniref:TMhelix containing protein n=1 Tax=Photorhabdus tasmaniensis TaxID=1004159 RepID=A0ABX0GMI3_9GAMM|nr:hypothetical protein [Photorhabdus tasmaniensis]NHB90467.1 hypothetical protein [Photorhabdus tasmaniensis]